MNQEQWTETKFERRLRAELRSIVAARGAPEAALWRVADAVPAGAAWRRRGPRVGLAAVAVCAVAAAVLIVDAGGGDTPPAFAVEARPEGMVSVEIRSPEDGQGLEQALAEVGVPASVTYLAPGTACREPRFRAAPWPQDAPTIVVGPPPGAPREPADASVVGGPEGARAVVQEPAGGGGPITFSVSRGAVAPGQTLVITAAAGAEGAFGADSPTRVDLAEGAVSPCEAAPAPPR